ncbi:MAG: response regulator receiver modulated metal dependent phosphohydrolase [Firmicutes bacterium]|nr:response regulator receiver modulated metal dependent phosphohydrolase [Bacillota bacterium]
MESLDSFLFEEDRLKFSRNNENIKLASKQDSWKILIVDDEEDVHAVTRMALRRLVFEGRNMEFLSAYSAAEAKEMLYIHSNIAVILLDVVMEDDTAGLSLVSYIRRKLGNTMVRIIIRTGNPGQALEEHVIMDYDINDYREKTELTTQRLRTAIVTALRSFRDLSTIDALNLEIEDTQKELVFALGEIAESRSSETSNHVKRVGKIAKILASKYKLPDYETEILRLAASMHDLGKLAIHDSILAKPGPLTLEEFATMKAHSEMGYEMLKASKRPLLQVAAIIAHQHHENYDGTGYPQRLKGKEIHLYSRIVALADVFDALGNERAYKAPWPNDKIKDYIKEQAGKKFDPHIVTLFLQNFSAISAVREMFPD